MFDRVRKFLASWWSKRGPPTPSSADPHFSLDRLFQGTIIFGATGSGKALARSGISLGFFCKKLGRGSCGSRPKSRRPNGPKNYADKPVGSTI